MLRTLGRRRLRRLGLGAAVVLASCSSSPTTNTPEPLASYAPPASSLRRLTQAQYENTIHDLFGMDVLVPDAIEPDQALGDFFSVGAAETSISSRGVSRYEAAAFQIAAAVMGSADKRAPLVTCTATGPSDEDCAKKVIAPLGKKLFRRPLTDDEVADFVAVAKEAGTTLGDFNQGLQFAMAALLQSPDFLFRTEIGTLESNAPTKTPAARYSGYEMASRLAYFLWNGPPDDELFAAADMGALDSAGGVKSQVDRMMASPKARRGMRNLVSEWLQLQGLDDLTKDPMIYTQASSDVGPSAREETLADFERIVFDRDGDVRDILTTRETSINRKLASIYGVRAPSQTGFALTELPAEQPRRGLLGQISMLAQNAHPTTTSPTLRGKFIRGMLLCQMVPPPPVNLNTAIPEPTPTLKTMRQRLTQHSTDAFCATCHKMMDPIGLGLEQFDGLGVLRSTESGETIDASGTLDGAQWSDAAGLAQVVHDHAALGPCIARRTYRYASGHVEADDEEGEIKWLGDRFATSGFKLKQLMVDVATSEGFRRAGISK